MRRSMTLFFLAAVAVSIALATLASPFASPDPDGLEKVAERQGFLEQGRLADVQKDAPIPDYAVPGVGDASTAAALAGLAGTLLTLAVGTGVGIVIVRRRRPATGV